MHPTCACTRVHPTGPSHGSSHARRWVQSCPSKGCILHVKRVYFTVKWSSKQGILPVKRVYFTVKRGVFWSIYPSNGCILVHLPVKWVYLPVSWCICPSMVYLPVHGTLARPWYTCPSMVHLPVHGTPARPWYTRPCTHIRVFDHFLTHFRVFDHILTSFRLFVHCLGPARALRARFVNNYHYFCYFGHFGQFCQIQGNWTK